MRLRSKDGTWRVDLISLRWTGDGRDGPRFRITRNGYFVAEVRTLVELARYVDPADLEETLIRLAAPGNPSQPTRSRNSRERWISSAAACGS